MAYIVWVSEWVKVAQSCPTLCGPMDYTIHGILQARIPEWVAFPFSRGSSQPQDWTQVSHTAGGFFTVWATREALLNDKPCLIRRKLTCYFLDNIARLHPPPPHRPSNSPLMAFPFPEKYLFLFFFILCICFSSSHGKVCTIIKTSAIPIHNVFTMNNKE